MKYKEKTASEIIRMIEQDLCSISEICKTFKISRKTFYEWKKEKPEFKEAVEEAIDHREDVMIASARIGLKQLLEGYIQKKEKISYIPDKNDPVNDVEKCRVVEKKFCPPSIRAIKYVLDREERKKEKQQLESWEKRPLVIEVQDEETRRQLMILKGNGFRSGGSLNPEIVAAVNRELEENKKMKNEEPEVKSEERKMESEELKVKNEELKNEQDKLQAQPAAAPVEKPKVNLYPFLPPGYTSRTD
ncbi:MAG: phBC6A51 family helix-turn-helix protein [Dysgonomonas sp.]|uniref:phBC6A51 family helix-turn-helix protein n=1 Tax=Dysgonomonas sp. TaxID=1891233 RepID=UPI003A8404ED